MFSARSMYRLIQYSECATRESITVACGRSSAGRGGGFATGGIDQTEKIPNPKTPNLKKIPVPKSQPSKRHASLIDRELIWLEISWEFGVLPFGIFLGFESSGFGISSLFVALQHPRVLGTAALGRVDDE